ncbi:hypothetical protein GBA52_002970 [Prunus armeniaca]|nr:hypothetical protein GBA52_002970 [Prunus armeniaca]
MEQRISKLRRERSGGRDRGCRVGRRSHESTENEEINYGSRGSRAFNEINNITCLLNQ